MAKMSEYTSVDKQSESVKARYMKEAMILSSGPSGSSEGKTNLNIPVSEFTKAQSDWNEGDTTSPAYIKNKPEIPEVKQADWNQEAAGQPDFIKNKPELHKVATTGNYNDLRNKPVIPEVVQANWAQNTPEAADYIQNKPDMRDYAKLNDLADVATSGNYEDLAGTPTKLSDFSNDTGFTANKGTVTKVKANGAVFEPSASGIVDIGETFKQADWNQNVSTQPDYIQNKPVLAEVATSGDYEDLDNKPTDVSEFNNDAGYQTAADIEAAVADKANKSEMSITDVQGELYKKTITLKNGLSANVITEHQDIDSKANKSELQISSVSGDNTKKKIQLLSDLSTNVVVEHQDISGKADLSAVYTKSQLNPILEQKADADHNHDDLYYRKGTIDSALGNKQDLINDLDEIRTGAEAGATAVQPSTVELAISIANAISQGSADLSWNGSDLELWCVAGLKNDFHGVSVDMDYINDNIEVSYDDLEDKPDIYSKTEVDTALSGKQDTISDLENIRDGAVAGSTAVQPDDLADVATSGDYNDLENTPEFVTGFFDGHNWLDTFSIGSEGLGGLILSNEEVPKLSVNAGPGIDAALGVTVRLGNGLEFDDNNAVALDVNQDFTFEDSSLKFCDDITGKGLFYNGSGNRDGAINLFLGDGLDYGREKALGYPIEVKLGDGLEFGDHGEYQQAPIAVKLGDGLEIDDTGAVAVKAGDGLNIDASGNLNADKDNIVLTGTISDPWNTDPRDVVITVSTTFDEVFTAVNSGKDISLHLTYGDHMFVFKARGSENGQDKSVYFQYLPLYDNSELNYVYKVTFRKYRTGTEKWLYQRIDTYEDLPKELPEVGSGTSYDRVFFLPANTSSSSSTQEPPEWRSLSEIIPEVREVPESSISDAGKVLTVKSNGEPDWAVPSGGGGTPTAEAISMIYRWDPTIGEHGDDVLDSVSMTPEQALQKYASGVALTVNVIRTFNGEATEIYSYPASYMYKSDGYYPIIFFNYGKGSGGGEGVTASIDPDNPSGSEWSWN